LCLLAYFVRPPEIVPLSELLELHRNNSVAPFLCKPPMAHHEEAVDQIVARIPLRLEALSATRYASNKSVVNDVDGWELLILHKR
jgi:hypothetical protein